MSKVEINKVAESLKKNQIKPETIRKILEELNLTLPEEDGEEKAPAVKKQFVVVVSDPEGRITGDFAGWVVQIPETESAATATDRIIRAAYEFNTTKKGRLLPVQTVGEAIENVGSKHFKEADVWIKTKTPVLLVKTDNSIPKDNSK